MYGFTILLRNYFYYCFCFNINRDLAYKSVFYRTEKSSLDEKISPCLKWTTFFLNLLSDSHIIYFLLLIKNNIFSKTLTYQKIKSIWFFSLFINFHPAFLGKLGPLWWHSFPLKIIFPSLKPFPCILFDIRTMFHNFIWIFMHN